MNAHQRKPEERQKQIIWLQRVSGLIVRNMKIHLNHLRRARKVREGAAMPPYVPTIVTLDRAIAFLFLIVLLFVAVDPILIKAVRELPQESRDFFGEITRFGGSHWYIVPAAVLLLLLWFADWRRLKGKARYAFWRLAFWASAALISVAGSGIAVNLIKRMIGRARPSRHDEMGSFAFEPFGFSSAFASFPSGHSTTAGAMIVLMTVFIPRFRWVWITLGVSIALSRVVVGAHYISDIVAGLAFGAMFTWLTLAYFARRRLGFSPAADNPYIIETIRLQKEAPVAHQAASLTQAMARFWRAPALPNVDNTAKKPDEQQDLRGQERYHKEESGDDPTDRPVSMENKQNKKSTSADG